MLKHIPESTCCLVRGPPEWMEQKEERTTNNIKQLCALEGHSVTLVERCSSQQFLLSREDMCCGNASNA